MAAALIFSLSLASCLAACGRNVEAKAAAAYSDARAKLNQGELVSAGTEVDSALQLKFPPRSDWPARFTVLKAEVLMHQKNYRESLALLDPPLPSSLASSDAAVRRLLMQAFGDALSHRFPDANRRLDEAQAIAQSSQPQLLANVAVVRGNVEYIQGRLDAAERDFREAVRLSHARADLVVETNALGSMGFLTVNSSRFDESVDWNTQALHAAQLAGAKDSVGRVLGNLGWGYDEMGDFEKALEYYQQGEASAARAGSVADRIIWLNGMASMHFKLHDYTSAEANWRLCLDLARSSDDANAVTEALNNLSLSALTAGRVPDAERYNRNASELAQKGTDPTGRVFSILYSAAIHDANRDFPEAERLFAQVTQDPAARPSVKFEAEARLARVYAEEGRPAAAEPLFRKSIESVEFARRTLKHEEFRLAFLSDAIAFYNDFIDFLISRNRVADALQVAELSRARTLADGLGIASSELSFPIRNFQPSQTAAKLKSTILSYWLGSPHSYLWVVSPQHLDVFTLPAAPEIDSVVQSYRKALTGPLDPLDSRNQAGQLLFDMLIGPARGKIPPHARVTILPDGSLYNLNFEALIASSPQLHYWIDDADIDYANSLVVLSASARETPTPSKKLLLIGAPVSPASDFPDLPQAATEIGLVENHFPSAERVVIQRDSATPAAYLDSHPEQFSFIHFVAHGIASRIDPLDSAVILTRQNDAYKLYARDIIREPIRADMVTISACHGAGERTFSGEGLVGLNWAFLRAGARSVISALWEVDDSSTPQLMDHLYAEISKGVAPSSALRDAKLALLRSGTVYRKPFYWAPFQLYRGI